MPLTSGLIWEDGNFLTERIPDLHGPFPLVPGSAPNNTSSFGLTERARAYMRPFSLKTSGESVVLFNASQQVVDKMDYPAQLENVSYGRSPDGGEPIGYLSMPTPGNANPESLSQEIGMDLEFSHVEGFYPEGNNSCYQYFHARG